MSLPSPPEILKTVCCTANYSRGNSNTKISRCLGVYLRKRCLHFHKAPITLSAQRICKELDESIEDLEAMAPRKPHSDSSDKNGPEFLAEIQILTTIPASQSGP